MDSDSPDAPARESMRTRYEQVVRAAVFAADTLATETALVAAADLGREMVRRECPPEEIAELHHLALLKLASETPDMTLIEVAERLTAPLMEASMAYSLSFRELTERRAAAMIQARLEQSRRLEAIGTLAAGIAHDFNNIIAAILGFAELLGDDLPAEATTQRRLALIRQASLRARDLVARLLTFAREIPDAPAPVELVGLIAETLELLRASLPGNVAIEFHANLEAAWILAEPSQVQQILMNLCINAVDAMENGHGLIDVQLAPTATGQIDGVEMKVRDNGSGMTEAVLQRAFDPFFTSKAPGKGSGLGLSVVHGIVCKLGGTIRVESAPGAGTRFLIWLPRVAADAVAAPRACP